MLPLLIVLLVISLPVRAGSPDSTAVSLPRPELQEPGSRWLAGAGIGFVAGTATAFLLFHTGGSTSLCNRDENQDAIRPVECLGLAALVGGLPGAGLGALIGSRIHHETRREIRVDQIRMGWVPYRDGEFRVVLTRVF